MSYVHKATLIRTVDNIADAVRDRCHGIDAEIEDLKEQIKELRREAKNMKADMDAERRLRQGRHMR